MFRAIISPIFRSTRLCLQLVVVHAGDQEAVELEPVPLLPGHQREAWSVLYTTSCKHSLVLLRKGEIIAPNMLSWLKLLIIKLLLLHLVGCLYYCINYARSHKHQIQLVNLFLQQKFLRDVVVIFSEIRNINVTLAFHISQISKY